MLRAGVMCLFLALMAACACAQKVSIGPTAMTVKIDQIEPICGDCFDDVVCSHVRLIAVDRNFASVVWLPGHWCSIEEVTIRDSEACAAFIAKLRPEVRVFR